MMGGFSYCGETQAVLTKGPDSRPCLSELPAGDQDEVVDTQLDQSNLFQTLSGR